jgi:uncharacterized membrane protein
MKKLRMIVTSVIVLAIVGSAFAFKVKAGAFCVLTSTASGDVCTAIKTNFRTTTVNDPGLNYKYFQNWDGDATACTTTTNHLCTGTVRLTTN